MAVPTNQLQNVRRYMNASLALLLNQNVFLGISNKKFKDFDKVMGNLGDTIDFELPVRYVANDSLVATFQGTQQRVRTLAVTNAKNVATAFTAQQFIFNVETYMDKFGKSAMAELGAVIEANVGQVCETTPFRFFGDGISAINSYTQLAQAMANFRDFGSAQHDYRGIIPLVDEPAIVGEGQTRFTLDRGNTTANSWELGKFTNANWYTSNLLPLHTAGTMGNGQITLTVVSINASGDVITVNKGAGADPFAIFENDSLQFQDGVSGQPNIRFLTFVGHIVSGQPVQVRATADAAALPNGDIAIPIDPPLISAPITDVNRNLNTGVVAGMELLTLPDHRCGLIYSGDALFLGMPKLPQEDPFFTVSETDPSSGASLRMYSGSKFAQNERGTIWDSIWAKTLVAEYSMKLAFPV